MKFTTLIFVTFLSSFLLGFKQKSTAEDIPFVFSKTDFTKVERKFEKKVTAEDSSVKSGFPIDIPSHNCFNLEDKKEFPAFEKGARYFSPAYSFICFIPTFDKTENNFAKAYPNFSIAVSKLNKLLAVRPTNFSQFKDIIDVPYNNSGWSFKCKVQYLNYQNISGVFFLTQYSQDMTPNLANNEELTANFQGITKDEKYYVAARFGITHPSLPRGIDFTDQRVIEDAFNVANNEEMNKKVRTYLIAEEKKLENLSDESFKPSLTSLKKLISSIDIK